MTASYTLSSKCNRPLKDYVYTALGEVIAQHPILSAISVDEHTQDPHFVRLPEIHLDECVLFQQRRHAVPGTVTNKDAESDGLLSRQHRSPYQSPRPFWWLCILTSTTQPYDFMAAFFYHHALGDGNSGLAFHRAFYHALQRAVSKSDEASIAVVVPSPCNPLLPSLESLHPLPVTIWHLLKTLFREKVWSSRDLGLWTGGKCTTPIGQSRVRHLALSSSATTAFKNLCRQNKTTITAALQTLVAGVLFSQLPDKYDSLKCSGALSMRRFLNESAGVTDDSMGVLIQDLSETYSRNAFQAQSTHSMLPWSEAQRSRRTIEHALSLKGTNTVIGLLRYVKNFQEELLLSKIGKERNSSFEVSNLGVFKPTAKPDVATEGTDAVKIGRMIFTQSAGVTSAAIQICVLTGVDGCLVLGVSWQADVVEDELVEKVVDGVRVEIERLVNTR